MYIRKLLMGVVKLVKYLLHASIVLCCYLIFVSVKEKDFQLIIFVASMFLVNIFIFIYLDLVEKKFLK
ncbi:hypothetical protein I6U48_26565 [Clostridium sp. PL3]|uniref:Uncharacterized protein n=1 Tax=Clostridium thailandense TaxID=2794346 RepID=A0A949U4Q0_9CLOT|nr:hypothetical protein [Clostridium thailandense]MBV7276448.1 hypothetical protein [Clostridium thailandense]